MKRYRQTFEEIENSLIPIEASWLDTHAEEVIGLLKTLPIKRAYDVTDVAALLTHDFQVATTAIRLFLDLSKDEFVHRMGQAMGAGGIGKKRYLANPPAYLKALDDMGLCSMMTAAVHQPLHWSDLFIERLKGGRGSAIKGQTRGRSMEDFDVLGDIARIVEEKRHDTVLLLVTDGITWKQRPSDLRKLVALQNEGKIQRIYTKSMAEDLRLDLDTLKAENER